MADIAFFDIVEFSKLSDHEQTRTIESLTRTVTKTLRSFRPWWRRAVRSRDVVCIPTGDGMALAFKTARTERTVPVLFQLIETLMAWASENRGLRIGVHTGAVDSIRDVNGNWNLCGTTINMCQRIMDAAHANQVLFSAEAVRRFVGSVDESESVQFHQPPYDTNAATFTKQHEVVAKHGVTVNVRIMYQQGDGRWVTETPASTQMTIIHGKTQRTRFLVERLQPVAEAPPDGTHAKRLVLEQASYSSLWISPASVKLLDEYEKARDEEKAQQPGDDDSVRQREDARQGYNAALLDQKRQLMKLIKNPGVEVKMLMNPPSGVPRDLNELKRRIGRLTSLVDSLSETASVESFDFVWAKHRGPNRVIVSPEFTIEGYKKFPRRGFDLNLVSFDEGQVGRETDDFLKRFNDAKRTPENATKEQVIKRLEDCLEQLRRAANEAAASEDETIHPG